MSEMVERVAKAIDASIGEDEPFFVTKYKAARAAIAAMREPTPEMYAAHVRYCEARHAGGNAPTKEGSWQAMIDAALSE